MESQGSPVIKLDRRKRVLVRMLRWKLIEYESRREKYRPPGLDPTFYKEEVLKKVLEDGFVNTWELSREMSKRLSEEYDFRFFNNACAVVGAYCKQDFDKIAGGTGLQKEGQHG